MRKVSSLRILSQSGKNWHYLMGEKMYKLISNPFGETTTILRLSDRANIPMDEANADYQIYLKWLDGYEYNGMTFTKVSDGNTPEPADPIPVLVKPEIPGVIL